MSPSALGNPFQADRLNTHLDFRPEWDVPELNQVISDKLTAEIRKLGGQKEPRSEQKIQVLLAPAGYGKTHLFGRVDYLLDREVFFIFVPALEEKKPPLAHILWHTVESLFQARPGQPSLLVRGLARLCQPSFVEYLGQLPPSLAAAHQQLLQNVQDDPGTILEIVQAVKPLLPFEKLADSVVAALPQAPADVARALAMGWAPEPWATCARRWLRGESLPEADLAALHLGVNPPHAMDVLKAIPALLRYEMPMVLSCDQMESVLKDKDVPIQFLTNLMDILQSVPVQVVISCLEDKWLNLWNQAFLAFKQRVGEWLRLQMLTPSQAVEMIQKRLHNWAGRGPEMPKTWPFDETSIISWVQDDLPAPRNLIRRCDTELNRWIAEENDSWIYLRKNGDKDDLGVLFLQEWNKELEAIGHDPARTPENRPVESLFRGIKEACRLAQKAERDMGGVRVTNVQENALPAVANTKGPALKLDLAAGKASYTALVAVTKLDNGVQFQPYYAALERAFADPVVGVVLIHHRDQPRMGPKTNTRVALEEARKKDKVRLFPLQEHLPTYARLECLLNFLDKAEHQEFQLGQYKDLSPDDCRDLILKTAVLDSLDLFKTLAGWYKPPAPAAGKATQPALATVGAGVAVTAGKGATIPDAPVVSAVVPPASKPSQSQPTIATPGATNTAQPSQPTPAGDGKGPKEVQAWAAERLVELAKTLKVFGLEVEPRGFEIGPTFGRLKVHPLGKTTIKKVCDRAEDIKLHLELETNPLIDSHGGNITVDVQLPQRRFLPLAEATLTALQGKKGMPTFPVGQDVSGQTHWLNLADPADSHLLVAGTPGSGKSEFLKMVIAALAQRLPPKQVQFVLIDPKRVTFNFSSEASPYFWRPLAYSVEEALPHIQACFEQTEERFLLMQKHKVEHVSQLQDAAPRPYVVVIVDEFADLVAEKAAKKALEMPLKRIAAKGRAAGIHLVLATQRPEAPGVFPPALRSCLPGRICLKVASEADSKIVIDVKDGAYLLGTGDLLWKKGGGSLIRLQSPWVTKEALEAALQF